MASHLERALPFVSSKVGNLAGWQVGHFSDFASNPRPEIASKPGQGPGRCSAVTFGGLFARNDTSSSCFFLPSVVPPKQLISSYKPILPPRHPRFHLSPTSYFFPLPKPSPLPSTAVGWEATRL